MDLTTVWTARDGTVALVPVRDCGDRVAFAVLKLCSRAGSQSNGIVEADQEQAADDRPPRLRLPRSSTASRMLYLLPAPTETEAQSSREDNRSDLSSLIHIVSTPIEGHRTYVRIALNLVDNHIAIAHIISLDVKKSNGTGVPLGPIGNTRIHLYGTSRIDILGKPNAISR